MLKQLGKSSRSKVPILSIVYTIQTMLLLTHFDVENSSVWIDFTDGFQYFKFNFRFLNPIFNIRERLDGHSSDVPSRMYNLFLEDRSAII